MNAESLTATAHADLAARITGSIVALVTPMLDDGQVDREALLNLVDWHLSAGTNAIVAVGTTGESATLDVREHCQVIQQIVDRVAGRIPVIAGTGANSTTEAIELTLAAKQAGADACLLVTPYYNKPTQEGLYLHHKAIAEAVDIPQILYNVPGRTAVDMQPETVARLASIDNIIGIKDATGDLQRGAALLPLQNAGFRIYSGDDETAVDYMLMGASGDISVTANVAPNAMVNVCRAAVNGDKSALELNKPLQALHRDLFLEANPIPVKWALFKLGRIGQGIRLPMTVLDAQYQAPLTAALSQADLL